MSADDATLLWPPDEVIPRRRALLAWYDEFGRDLPWRRRPSLYGTWISEIMLQQTTVAAVLPRWEEFLRRFPDVAALAAAEESEVLALWSGLGYYRRARSLHQAARTVQASGGDLPSDRVGWRALPGVGEYAAGAVASIGLGLAEVAIDANVRRVLTRWSCADAQIAKALRPANLKTLAAAHLDPDRPGDWNQALMDLGAGPCRAEAPRCQQCPVSAWCAAGRAGQAAQVPPPSPKRALVPVSLGMLVVRLGGAVLVLPPASATVGRIPGQGDPWRSELGSLLAGTRCLPTTPWYRGDLSATHLYTAAWADWLPGTVCRHVGRFRHTITNHRLLVHVVLAESLPAGVADTVEASWQDLDGSWPCSTLVARALSLAGGAGS